LLKAVFDNKIKKQRQVCKASAVVSLIMRRGILRFFKAFPPFSLSDFKLFIDKRGKICYIIIEKTDLARKG
jgi:hypothetical protein